jgi:prepilin-type N-terminal cleavage/methylation domain-containing protein
MYASIRPRTGRAAFTLIEITAVVVILAILIVILVPKLLGGDVLVKQKACRGFLATLETKIRDYELDAGDWPPSSPPPGTDMPNKVNIGAELLVISLYAPGRPSPGLPDDRLGNTDGDSARKSLTSLPLAALYEIVDEWKNPIVYIHRSDYEQVFEYQTLAADGSEWTQSVRAKKNPKTDTYFNSTSFQLLSAGPDGEFGTKDDVANYEEEQ